MVDTINDALGTDIDPVYVECPVDSSVHDTMADASKLREATGWEPEIDFLKSVDRVRAPYREADASGTNEAGRGRDRKRGRPESRRGPRPTADSTIGPGPSRPQYLRLPWTWWPTTI